jgi:hypothetical protein
VLCEIDLMILFICQNLSDLLRHGKLTQSVTLPHDTDKWPHFRLGIA